MNGLEVFNITDKVYKATIGHCGVSRTPIRVSFLVNPLWVIIDPSRKHSVKLSSVRAEGLYLPAGRSLLGDFYSHAEDLERENNMALMSDFTPAITGPGQAWRSVYKSKRSDQSRLPDYSGYTSLTLFNKWDKLSRTADGAAQILNLIFTDYAANLSTGTRSQLTITDLRPGKSTSGKNNQS